MSSFSSHLLFTPPIIALLTGFLDVAPRLVTSRDTLGPLLSLSILDTDASNPLCYNKRRENVPIY